jgi:hypothetical protein
MAAMAMLRVRLMERQGEPMSPEAIVLLAVACVGLGLALYHYLMPR